MSAVYLDVRNKFVGLSNGREIEYDKLLIATGVELRTLSTDTRGVSYLHSLDDADHLMQLLSKRESSCRAAVYGGGFIACEYINIFAHFGIPTCIAFRGSHFWQRLLEPEAGELLNQVLDTNGIERHANAIFSETIGEKELIGFRTSLGEYPCSILGIGVGVQSDFEFVKQAGVEVGIGIKCNEYLQTSALDIYAAGDVAEFQDVVVDRQLKIGNWMNAIMQGRLVAHNMVGKKKIFELVSSYATNLLGKEIIFVGDVSKEHADEMRVFGSAAEGNVTQLFGRGGKLVGAVLLGRNKDRAFVTEMIRTKRPLAGISI